MAISSRHRRVAGKRKLGHGDVEGVQAPRIATDRVDASGLLIEPEIGRVQTRLA
jgi:hypothetical protein